jgi:hypothetical protein
LFIGNGTYSSGNFTTSGSGGNIGLGRALKLISSGTYNTGIGFNALYSVDTGSNNVGLGQGAGSIISGAGSDNLAIGSNAMGGNLGGNTGSFNIAVGASSLTSASFTGVGNTAVGRASGYYITSGTYNTFLGYNSGLNASQGATVTNSMALGNGTYTTADNQVVIGNTSVTQTLLQKGVGIGTSSPATALDIVGTTTIESGRNWVGYSVCYLATGALGHQTSAQLALLQCDPN